MINVGCLFTSRTRWTCLSLFLLFVAIMCTKIFGEPSVGEKLIAVRDFSNQFHEFAVKVLNGEEIVGHLPCKYSSIVGNFLAHGGSITLKVTGHRQHCKQICGGMEIPCCVTFSCSRKRP